MPVNNIVLVAVIFLFALVLFFLIPMGLSGQLQEFFGRYYYPRKYKKVLESGDRLSEDLEVQLLEKIKALIMSFPLSEDAKVHFQYESVVFACALRNNLVFGVLMYYRSFMGSPIVAFWPFVFKSSDSKAERTFYTSMYYEEFKGLITEKPKIISDIELGGGYPIFLSDGSASLILGYDNYGSMSFDEIENLM